MMAPSRDTSFKVFTPVVPPTPVRIVTDLIVDTIQPAISSSEDPDLTPTKVIPSSQPLRIAMPQLASSGAAFLLSNSPIKSSSNPPNLPTMEISPVKQHRKQGETSISELLTIPVKSPLEKCLQEALVLKNAEANFFRGRTIQLQSAMVLQRVYCGRVRRQLNAKERKMEKNSKRGRREKIDGNGLGRLLTEDELFNVVVEHEVAMEAEEREKEARKQKKNQFDIDLSEWAKNEEARKKRNEERAGKWKAAVQEWGAAKAAAKAAKAKIKDWERDHPKPKKKDADFAPEPAVARPKLRKGNEVDAADEDGEEFNEDEWTEEE